MEEASQGFAPCQEQGGKGGGCRLGSGFALHLCLEPSFPSKAKGFPLGCLCTGEESFPSRLLERGAAGGGNGEQMEGLEEHQVAAASLGRGDPIRHVGEEEEEGLTQWLEGAWAEAQPATL